MLSVKQWLVNWTWQFSSIPVQNRVNSTLGTLPEYFPIGKPYIDLFLKHWVLFLGYFFITTLISMVVGIIVGMEGKWQHRRREKEER